MKKFLLSMLVMAVRILNSAEILAQPKMTPVFEHVHALAMESAGHTLFLATHAGLFRSDDRGRS